MRYIKFLDKIDKDDVELVGGKAASLGEMIQVDIPVPNGFVVTAEAFHRFLDENDLEVEIDAALHSVEGKGTYAIQRSSSRVQGLIMSSTFPKSIKEEIMEASDGLMTDRAAVRSSAVFEDSTTETWAGQLDTFLNVDKHNILKKIKRCWASIFSPRALFYRLEKNAIGDAFDMSVIVQNMIRGQVSGTAFSVHPVVEDPDQLVIEAGFGLGQAVVSGQITPDNYVVRKKDWKILDKNINLQKRAVFIEKEGGTAWKEVPPTQRRMQVLTDDDIKRLAHLVVRIEDHYGSPVDIEWTKDKLNIYIVQSRPITTLRDRPRQRSLSTHVLSVPWLEASEDSWPFLCSWIANDAFTEGMSEKLGWGGKNTLNLFQGGVRNSYYSQGDVADFERFLNNKVEEDAEFINKNLKNLHEYSDNLEEKSSKFKQSFSKSEAVEYYNEIHSSLFDVLLLTRFAVLVAEVAGDTLDIGDRATEAEGYARNIINEVMKETFPKLLHVLSDVLNVSTDDIGVLTPHEMDIFLETENMDRAVMTKSHIKKRQDACVVATLGGVVHILYDEDAKQVIERVQLEFSSDAKIVRGQVAHEGFAEGRVRVISSDNDWDKIGKGEVVVAHKASVENTPHFKEASAIVTDEGGITSHAAIIARELEIPCVIGTHNSTRVLRDGDKVEVDADEGVVRLIERSDK